MRTRYIDPASVKLLGFSPWPLSRITSALASGLHATELPGDFILTGRGRDSAGPFEFIASSVVACRNYYFVLHHEVLYHGANLFDVVDRAKLGWKWNARAILCVLTASYTVQSDTLHSDVRRFPPATELIARGSSLEWRDSAFWDVVFDKSYPRVSVNVAYLALRRCLEEASTNELSLSLSAGFDSRAILAVLLSLGIKPVVGTMGFESSTDMLVAASIANKYGLEHHRLQLRADDYLKFAKEITETTGGSKPAEHWHTYIYIKLIGFSVASLHLAGSNGEFARTYWYDRNPLAILVDRLPWNVAASIVKDLFYKGPYSRRFRSLVKLVPDKLHEVSPLGLPHLFSGLLSEKTSGLNKLDRMHELNSIHNFIGNGVSLYSACYRTMSPFLDIRWISAAAGLSRRDKIGSNFHRYVVHTAFPPLARFPIGKESVVKLRAPWKWGKSTKADISYSAFDQVSALPGFREEIGGSKHLCGLFDKALLKRAVLEPSMLSGLAAIHFAGEVAMNWRRDQEKC